MFATQETFLTSDALTTFEDTNTTLQVDYHVDHSRASTYTTPEAAKSLEKEYILGTREWKSTDVNPSGFDVILGLCNQPLNKAIMKHHRIMKCGAEVTIRLHSTPMHYGKMAVYWVPFSIKPGLFPTLSLLEFPHVIISASTAEPTTMVLPLFSPNEWFRCPPTNAATSDYIGSTELGNLYFVPLHRLGSSTTETTQTLKYTVSARFTDIELSSPMFAESAKVDQETQQKSERKILSGVAEGATIVFDSVKSLPIIGEIASVAAPIAQTLGGLFKTIGLEKPTDVSILTKVKQTPTDQLAQSRGADMSQRFTMSATSTTTTDSSIYKWKDAENERSVKFIAMKPSAIKSGNITSTTTGNVFTYPISPLSLLQPSVSTGIYLPTNLAAVALESRFWRGSIKFKILFSASKFTTATLRLVWLPDHNVKVIPSNDSGSMVNKVIEIAGDCETEFTIPYDSWMPWLSTDSASEDIVFNGRLYLEVISPPVSTGNIIGSMIQYTVFVAGGEDIAFKSLSGTKYSYTANATPAMIAESSMSEDFKKTFSPLAPSNYVCHTNLDPEEEIENVNDIFLLPRVLTGSNFSSHVCEFAKLFMMSRYGLRVKMVRKDTEPYLLTYANGNGVINQQLWLGTEQFHELELPYCSHQNYLLDSRDTNTAAFTNHNRSLASFRIEKMDGTAVAVSSLAKVFVSYSDDSTFAFLRIPGFLRYTMQMDPS